MAAGSREQTPPRCNCEAPAWQHKIRDWLEPLPAERILLLHGHISSGAAPPYATWLEDQEAGHLGGSHGEKVLTQCLETVDSRTPPDLPFVTGAFDLVIGDGLGAHLDITPALLGELRRLLISGGYLLLLDRLVPGSHLRGKKARQLRHAGEFINAWFALRTPDHRGYLSIDAWTELFSTGAWKVHERSECESIIDFDLWLADQLLDRETRTRLEAMLIQAPENVQRFLTPRRSGDRIAFRLVSIAILATAIESGVAPGQI
jgi:SAM-dependent methyltransferase